MIAAFRITMMSITFHNPLFRWMVAITGIVSILLATISFAQASAPGVSLSWNPSSDPNTVGYKLYYGTSSGNYTGSVTVGNETTAPMPNLQVGTTYFFVVTAYDGFGTESLPSNEASYHGLIATSQPVHSTQITAPKPAAKPAVAIPLPPSPGRR